MSHVTAENWDALLERTRITERMAAAARMVLVDGLSNYQAAEFHGIRHAQAVHRAVQRIRAEAAKMCENAHSSP